MMNVLDEAKKRPMASGLTLVGAAGVVVLAMNVMPGLELIVRIKKAPDVADAAMGKAVEAEGKASDAREWIDRYIKDQEEQRVFDQKLAEKEAEYQQKMLDLQQQQVYQQQQAPNQMRVLPPPPQDTTEYWRDPTDGSLWCCESDRDDCRVNDNWFMCE